MINGTVNKVLTNNWTAPDGKEVVLYGFTVEGDDRLFGLGATQVPTIQKGVGIEFEAKMVKGKWKADPRSVVIKNVAPPAPVGNTPPPANSYAQTKAEKDAYWASKDLVIELQSCRNSAIALAEILLAQGAVPQPKKKEDQYQAVVDLVDELTETFIEQNANVRAGKPFNDSVDTGGSSDSEGQDEDEDVAEQGEWN